MIKIYNSLTNRLEEFKPIKENEVTMYVCGSTTYNHMHIGNTRPIVFFDTVARFFRYMGYNVKHVSNFTDIDDKIIKKAKEEGVDEKTISERYITSILEDNKLMNCLPHYRNPRVTQTIPQIISFIQLLLNNGGAYVIDGDVYFDVDKVQNYGAISGQTKENLLVGARISENEKKHNAIDFNLWKETNEGLNWTSPWSCGRPGWHTECVVMINDIFHSMIDIHGGGSDLKFPHHENELAQAEIAFHNSLAHYWMHNGRVDMNNVKMSKSLGNVVMAKDLLNEIGYGAYRLMMLNVPYTQPFNYKDDVLHQAISDYDRISHGFISLARQLQIRYNKVIDLDNIMDRKISNLELEKIRNEFIDAMSNDFSTPNAITTILKMLKFTNNILRNNINEDLFSETFILFYQMLYVFGIEPKFNQLNDEQLVLVKSWQQARNEKRFEDADKFRQLIQEQGIVL